MPVPCCILALSAALCLLKLLCCTHGAPVSPSGSTLMLCQAQMMCGNQFYDPQQHCCLKDTLVPLGDTRRCGSCSYRVCFEQCCDRWPPEQKEPLMVKLNVEDCSIPSPGDRLCQSVS
ncbi:insulin growth factor-like family member 1 [Cavia porcellus]|uniref:insulin growth factor-like family member 1 n=1 Tax=Cavia porcellus TaxID=10141 RepID=UPI000661E67A|nr:insulin growth factor-like family member 1 isoform X2 [Cavia porcellus]